MDLDLQVIPGDVDVENMKKGGNGLMRVERRLTLNEIISEWIT